MTGPFVESPNVRAIAASTGGPVLIEDATLQAQDAIRVSGAATIRRVDVTAVNGFNLQSDDPAGGSFLIEDSVWRTPPGAAEGRGLLGVCGATADAELTARNLTLVDGASGPGFHPAVASICNAAGRSTSMTLHSSIALDPENAVVAIATSGTSTLAVSYSDFDPAKAHELGFGTSEITQGPGNVNVAPGFAGVEDFALLPGSPLVDAGDPAGLVAGESTTDLAGAPRITDGNGDGVARRDIGAYELPPQPPAVTQPPPPRPTVDCRGAALPRTDGTDGDNNIVGTAAADAIFGFGGKDEIDGADGNDCLNGGGGNDLLRGGAGKDVVKGGAGVDKVRGQGGKDKLRGNGGKDRLNGGGGDDKAVVDPVDRAARNCETVREVEKE